MNIETEEVEEQVYSEAETFNFKVSMIMEFADGAAIEANYYRGVDAESVTEARALFLDQFNSLTISQLIEEAKDLNLWNRNQTDQPVEISDYDLDSASISVFSAHAEAPDGKIVQIELKEIG